MGFSPFTWITARTDIPIYVQLYLISPLGGARQWRLHRISLSQNLPLSLISALASAVRLPNTVTDTSNNTKATLACCYALTEVHTHKRLKITVTPLLPWCHLFDNTVIDTSNNTKATLACCYALIEVHTHKRLKITVTPSLPWCHLFDNTVIDTSNNTNATCRYALDRFIHTNR